MKRLAVDVGGTFTDFVILAEDGTVAIEKVPSLPDRPDDVFFEGIRRLGVDLRALETIVHGSTLVINTVVQRKGARVGPLFAGDTVSVRSGGGGGWGDPLRRDAAMVASEARNELISAETARQAYGVVLDPETLAVDEAATHEERERRRAGSG
jgi:N-methylhydantoinase B/oxoprolinase/acetone carboxylase alpha subunit